MVEPLSGDERPSRLHGVWLIGPDKSLEPLSFEEETVDGERRVYIASGDIDGAEVRARVKAGRFGTPRPSRPSGLAESPSPETAGGE